MNGVAGVAGCACPRVRVCVCATDINSELVGNGVLRDGAMCDPCRPFSQVHILNINVMLVLAYSHSVAH